DQARPSQRRGTYCTSYSRQSIALIRSTSRSNNSHVHGGASWLRLLPSSGAFRGSGGTIGAERECPCLHGGPGHRVWCRAVCAAHEGGSAFNRPRTHARGAAIRGRSRSESGSIKCCPASTHAILRED